MDTAHQVCHQTIKKSDVFFKNSDAAYVSKMCDEVVDGVMQEEEKGVHSDYEAEAARL
jgi:hypothetical protein